MLTKKRENSLTEPSLVLRVTNRQELGEKRGRRSTCGILWKEEKSGEALGGRGQADTRCAVPQRPAEC